MRIRRKKIDLTPADGGRVWPLFCGAGVALFLMPDMLSGSFTDALSTAQLPAVLLTCGLLSAVADRRK